MPDIELPALLKLDPWAVSSLLQKAIRRGEERLACRAGLTLYRQRGVAVFRRLCIIAVEDIGIADMALVQEVVRIGTDKQLRSVLGSDAWLIDDLCGRMAAATKDRSSDYLYCAATKLETALQDRTELSHASVAELISIAADPGIPVFRRAVSALLACSPGSEQPPIPQRVEQFLDGLSGKTLPLNDALSRLVGARFHPFCLMLPIIWSRWWHSGAKFHIAEDEMPETEFCNGVPLYTFDFHTAAGKSALARFTRENAYVREVLADHAHQDRWAEVVGIAAFYADAAPVARRLDWPTASLLRQMGLVADMGCSLEGANAILTCVRENLADLNEHRRTQLGRRTAPQK